MSAEKVALVYRVRGELPLPVVTADVGLQWNLPAECGVPFTFRQAIYEASFPVNGLRGAPRPPLQSPRPRGEIGASHCVRLRIPACGTAQLDRLSRFASVRHPWRTDLVFHSPAHRFQAGTHRFQRLRFLFLAKKRKRHRWRLNRRGVA